jgi:hypothetical protein
MDVPPVALAGALDVPRGVARSSLREDRDETIDERGCDLQCLDAIYSVNWLEK